MRGHRPVGWGKPRVKQGTENLILWRKEHVTCPVSPPGGRSTRRPKPEERLAGGARISALSFCYLSFESKIIP